MRRRAAELVDVEMTGQVLRFHPAVRRAVVAEAQQVVAERRGEVAALAQRGDRHAAAPLRLRRPARIEQERQVAVARHRQSQDAQQEQLARRVAEVIVTAQYVCHAHECVVDCIAEEEHGAAVGAPHQEIADRRRLHRLRAAHQVIEAQRLRPGDRETQGGLAAGGYARRARSFVEPAAGPGISRRLAGRELRAARDLELGGRAEARVGVALALEALEESRVEARAFRLAVGTAAVFAARARVEVEPEPGEVRELVRDERLAAALAVGVLDAQR